MLPASTNRFLAARSKSKQEHIWCKPQLRENPCKPRQKKLYKFIKKITHVDDMMVHNLVKYIVQTRLRLLDIKITKFLFLYLTNEVEFGQDIL